MVVSIISLLVSFLLPALSKTRENTRNLTCVTTLRGIMQASALYVQDNRWYPTSFPSPWVTGDFVGTPMISYNQSSRTLCGVGQLMYSNYLPESKKAIACPQTDYREDKGYNNSTWMPNINYSDGLYPTNSYFTWVLGLNPAQPSYYYRNILDTASSGATLYGTYGQRGGSYKLSTAFSSYRYPTSAAVNNLADSDAAFFLDYEAAKQSLLGVVGSNLSPLIGWGRVHTIGVNVAYIDGHVAMFEDPDRSKTWWGYQTWAYGNAYAYYVYDGINK